MMSQVNHPAQLSGSRRMTRAYSSKPMWFSGTRIFPTEENSLEIFSRSFCQYVYKAKNLGRSKKYARLTTPPCFFSRQPAAKRHNFRGLGLQREKGIYSPFPFAIDSLVYKMLCTNVKGVTVNADCDIKVGRLRQEGETQFPPMKRPQY
jgi:hypothetical protein